VKKYLLVLVLLFIFDFVDGFSLDIVPAKEVYNSGDTFQVDISVNGDLQSEILVQNIELKCPETISIAPFLLRLTDDHYYSYFDIPSELGNKNCSFVINNLIYLENDFLEQKSFVYNFSLNDSNNSVYVNPAAVRITNIENQDTFVIQLINNGINTTNFSFSTMQTFFDMSKQSLVLNPGQSGQFYVYMSDFLYNNIGKAEIKIDYNSDYFTIPFFFLIEDEPIVQNQTITESRLDFVMDVDNFNLSVNYDESTSGFVKFKNYGDDINNLTFELTNNLEEVLDLQFNILDQIRKDETLKQYIYVNRNKNVIPGNYSGNLKINYDSKSIEFPVYIEIKEFFLDNHTLINNTVKNDTGKPKNEKSTISVWWFVGLFFVILITVFFLLYKKRNKKPTSFLKSSV